MVHTSPHIICTGFFCGRVCVFAANRMQCDTAISTRTRAVCVCVLFAQTSKWPYHYHYITSVWLAVFLSSFVCGFCCCSPFLPNQTYLHSSLFGRCFTCGSIALRHSPHRRSPWPYFTCFGYFHSMPLISFVSVKDEQHIHTFFLLYFPIFCSRTVLKIIFLLARARTRYIFAPATTLSNE